MFHEQMVHLTLCSVMERKDCMSSLNLMSVNHTKLYQAKQYEHPALILADERAEVSLSQHIQMRS